ncbi:endonuclease VII domain-containing protein [Streptomyces virginiae]|uniref:endonuclease VII domain-containing protein n=1 Tax=Streptomyces virginiae TaxID=1961 RepID=UPI0036E395EB
MPPRSSYAPEGDYRVCRDCEKRKHRSEYPGENLRYTYCRPCNVDRTRRSKYGMTADEKRMMLASQGGVCANAGCRADRPGGQGGWHTDHDHGCCPGYRSCGKCIRGLLCNGCNLALGFVKDSPQRLSGLISYLERSTA